MIYIVSVALMALTASAARRMLTQEDDNRRCLADFATETRSACELYTDLVETQRELDAMRTCVGAAPTMSGEGLIENDVSVNFQGQNYIVMIQDPQNAYDEVLQFIDDEHLHIDSGHVLKFSYQMYGSTYVISNNYGMQAFLRIPKSTRWNMSIRAEVTNTEMPTSAPTYTMPPTSSPTHEPTTIACNSILAQDSEGHGLCTLYANRITCWGVHGQYAPEFVSRWGQNQPSDPIYAYHAQGHWGMCAIQIDRTVECWDRTDRNDVSQVPNGLKAQMVSVGDQAACAINLEGTLICWGAASIMNHYPGASDARVQNVEYVSCGGNHCCTIRDGEINYCFGDNGQGQVAQKPSGNNYVQIKSGYHFSCALTTADTNNLVCWGYNAHGQGNVPQGHHWKEFGCGGYFTCGIEDDGNMQCWGHGNSGEFDLLNDYRGPYRYVSGTHHANCAMKEDYSIVCTGALGTYAPARGNPIYDQTFPCDI